MATVAAYPKAYLNGKFVALSEAKVPVTDRGFLFADSVYEVIPVYDGKLFCLQQHLTRLANSLRAIRLATPINDLQWEKILTDLIKQNGNGNQAIYLQVTRGATLGRQHALPENPQPTVFAMSMPLPDHNIDVLRQGISAIVLPDCRWTRCYIKSTALLPNILLNDQAKQIDADEAILIRDGMVTEGTSSNVFIVKDNTIYTPEKNDAILGGITRDTVVALAQQHAIAMHETGITEKQLQAADEIWVTSSTREIRPVVRLNNQTVGNENAGPLWERMITLYQTHCRQLTQSISAQT